ncbi:mlr0682 [Mesorhizobium japonicum MAFF 303099]|uniref:Mlr0682 protein n=1 Tax=Mesorhizobium japonicum (strain LMG 29417 / CECT 9101 / MAFF 303099) TaxID=266835 RepID=Q98M89_RHILO|nr:mlr0682 [Mesorhizobium japonicum MAFF 303099]
MPARSIRRPRPLFCRESWTGFSRSIQPLERNWAVERSRARPTPLDPVQNFAAAAKSPYRHQQKPVEDTGLSHHPRDDGRIDAEHLAVKLEHEIVQLPGQHHIAEIHVVERQVEPAPEQRHRGRPQCEDIAHQRPPLPFGPARPDIRESSELWAAAFAMLCAVARKSASSDAAAERRSASIAT